MNVQIFKTADLHADERVINRYITYQCWQTT